MKKYVAECIGTFTLVFVGCGSAMFLGCEPSGGHLAVALAFGLSIIATAYVIGDISGCHINPAVSLAMLMQKRLRPADFAGYVAAQVIGGLAGGGVLKALSAGMGLADLTGGLGSNGTANAGGIGGGLIIEILLSFFFIFTILGVTSDPKYGSVAGVVIGLTLTFVHIIGIPLTGTSVNPARSLGPAIFAGGDALSQVWVFIVGPLVGAVLASLVFSAIRNQPKAKKR